MELKTYTEKLKESFNKEGYLVEKNRSFPGFEADLFAFKEGYSFWKFLPYEDHIFIHIKAERAESIHEKERMYVNGLFKRPKYMRYKVPNIVTVLLSPDGFSNEDILYAQKPAVYGAGGEKHSVILIDIKTKNIYSQGLQAVRTTSAGGAAYMKITHKRANPSNRALLTITKIVKDIG